MDTLLELIGGVAEFLAENDYLVTPVNNLTSEITVHHFAFNNLVFIGQRDEIIHVYTGWANTRHAYFELCDPHSLDQLLLFLDSLKCNNS